LQFTARSSHIFTPLVRVLSYVLSST
jgi:hypothetical protein